MNDVCFFTMMECRHVLVRTANYITIDWDQKQTQLTECIDLRTWPGGIWSSAYDGRWNMADSKIFYEHYQVWDEITYTFPNFNGPTVEVWEWINNFNTLY